MKLGGSSITESFAPFAPLLGAAFNTFTTKQDVSPRPGGMPRIPGGALYIGDRLYMRAEGEASSTATPNLTLGLYLGTFDDASGSAPVITTDIIISAATAINTGAAWPWELECWAKVIKTGSSGLLNVWGRLAFPTSLTALTVTALPATAAARQVAINTTIDNRIGVSGTWSASSISNQVITYAIDAMRLN